LQEQKQSQASLDPRTNRAHQAQTGSIGYSLASIF